MRNNSLGRSTLLNKMRSGTDAGREARWSKLASAHTRTSSFWSSLATSMLYWAWFSSGPNTALKCYLVFWRLFQISTSATKGDPPGRYFHGSKGQVCFARLEVRQESTGLFEKAELAVTVPEAAQGAEGPTWHSPIPHHLLRAITGASSILKIICKSEKATWVSWRQQIEAVSTPPMVSQQLSSVINQGSSTLNLLLGPPIQHY